MLDFLVRSCRFGLLTLAEAGKQGERQYGNATREGCRWEKSHRADDNRESGSGRRKKHEKKNLPRHCIGMNNSHPVYDALESYAMGTLVDSELESLEEHLLLCPVCRQRVDEATTYVAAMRQAARRCRP